jgi:hypothetical protein
MLPDVTLPAPLSALLAVFAPCFTARSFRTFGALACGFLGQTGKRTVCGTLTGAGLSRIWPHDRAHSFFSRARWDPGDLGLPPGWPWRCWCPPGSRQFVADIAATTPADGRRPVPAPAAADVGSGLTGRITPALGLVTRFLMAHLTTRVTAPFLRS